MARILTPGYMYWDGSKYVLHEGTAGTPGPTGPTGATGATGPTGASGGPGTLGGDVTGPSDDNLVEYIQGLPTSLGTTADRDGLFARVTGTNTFSSPRTIIQDGYEAWIGEHDQSDNDYPVVYRVSVPDFSVVASIDLSTHSSSGVRDLAQDDNYVYASCWKDSVVAIISKSTNEVVGWGELYTSSEDPDRKVIAVCADNLGNFYAIGQSSVSKSEVMGVYKFITSDCIDGYPSLVAPDDSFENSSLYAFRDITYAEGSLWVTNGRSSYSMLSEIDPSTMTISGGTTSTNVGKSVAYNSDDGYLYVTDEDIPQLVEINPADYSVVNSSAFNYITSPDKITFGLLGIINVAMVTGDYGLSGAYIEWKNIDSTLYTMLSSTFAPSNPGEAIFYSGGTFPTWYITSYLKNSNRQGVWKIEVDSSGEGNSITQEQVLQNFVLAYRNVDYLQGYYVSNIEPDGNQVLTWNADTLMWEGSDSLIGYTEVSGDVALGYNTRASDSGGNRNITIGTACGTNMSGASFNSIVGAYAATNLTSGTYNTILGYDSEPAAGNDDYSIVIGAGATGKGDYSIVLGNNVMGGSMGSWQHTKNR